MGPEADGDDSTIVVNSAIRPDVVGAGLRVPEAEALRQLESLDDPAGAAARQKVSTSVAGSLSASVSGTPIGLTSMPSASIFLTSPSSVARATHISTSDSLDYRASLIVCIA